MTARPPAELIRGDRVRVLGRYRRRSVVMLLDRAPVRVDSGDWLLCGYQRRSGPTGNSRAFHTRFVGDGEPVEVLEEGAPRWRRIPGTSRLEQIPRGTAASQGGIR